MLPVQHTTNQQPQLQKQPQPSQERKQQHQLAREYLPFIKIFVYVELKILKYVLSSLIVVSAAAKQLKAGCCFNAIEIYSIQTGEQSVILWE